MPPPGLEKAGLVWADTEAPGYGRRRQGRGFSYLEPDGELVRDEDIRARLASLALPPAWVDEWYCLDPRRHIQALASDDRERRQYIYHPDWRAWRDRQKFAELADFVEALPEIRAAARRALSSGDAVERALGAIVTLLDKGAMRVGSERYAEENDAYGATSLRKRHVETEGGKLRLRYEGKGGKARDVAIRDKRLAEAVAMLEDLPGQRLFDVEDEGGELRRIDSDSVNRWLARIAGEGISAKDFRTLAGSVAALDALVDVDPGDTKRARDAALKTAYESAAERLGNTVTVAKTSYIHPAIAEVWAEGDLRRLMGRAKRMGLKVGVSERAVAALARDAAG